MQSADQIILPRCVVTASKNVMILAETKFCHSAFVVFEGIDAHRNMTRYFMLIIVVDYKSVTMQRVNQKQKSFVL